MLRASKVVNTYRDNYKMDNIQNRALMTIDTSNQTISAPNLLTTLTRSLSKQKQKEK